MYLALSINEARDNRLRRVLCPGAPVSTERRVGVGRQVPCSMCRSAAGSARGMADLSVPISQREMARRALNCRVHLALQCLHACSARLL